MNILIVEDEYAIALNMELQLQGMGHKVLGIANDFESVFGFVTETIPDIILMDINLGKGESGIDIAHRLRKIVQVPVVFLSAYSDDDTVSRALDTEPFGYLVKPYKTEDLAIAIQVARQNWINKLIHQASVKEHRKDSVVFIQSGAKLIKTRLQEILFLQGLDNYTIIQTAKDRIIASDYLSAVKQKIDYTPLVQCHRSYYVNKENIEMINGNTIRIGGFDIPVSRTYKHDFIENLNPI